MGIVKTTKGVDGAAKKIASEQDYPTTYDDKGNAILDKTGTPRKPQVWQTAQVPLLLQVRFLNRCAETGTNASAFIRDAMQMFVDGTSTRDAVEKIKEYMAELKFKRPAARKRAK